MKIYAIRDRLINYFMAPFAGPDQHADIFAAVATQVNGDTNDAICQAPHHFEIWTLGEVQEDGTLVPKREFLADCSSLVRTGIRKGVASPNGNRPPNHAQNESRGPLGGDPQPAGTSPTDMANTAPEPPTAVREAHPGSG